MEKTESRKPQKRPRDYPEYVGGNRPVNGLQIVQKLTSDHGVVLKTVKLPPRRSKYQTPVLTRPPRYKTPEKRKRAAVSECQSVSVSVVESTWVCGV